MHFSYQIILRETYKLIYHLIFFVKTAEQHSSLSQQLSYSARAFGNGSEVARRLGYVHFLQLKIH